MIGEPIPRVEGRDKVTGAAQYAAEAPIPDAAFGVIVQSPAAKGRVVEMDVSAAETSPGVITVLTPKNLPKIEWTFSGDTRGPLSDMNVMYAGQHLAVVVADTPERAGHAASLIRIVLETENPVVDIADPLAKEVPATADNDEPPQVQRGDVDAALGESGLTVIRETYRTPAETHNPMEPMATVASWDGDRLTVWDSTQGVIRTRDSLAKAFGLEPENVRVHCLHTGGGFGCKGEQWAHKFLAVAAAKVVGRPVRLSLTRRQMFTSCGHRPATQQEVTLAADKVGKVVAARHDSILETCPTNTHIEGCGMGTCTLYAIPNLQVSHQLRLVDRPPATWMRAPGEASGSFAQECAMDELAVALGIDPVELRLINHADVHPGNGKPWSTKHLKECYRRGAERFGWASRNPSPGSMTDPKGLKIGWGMATAEFPGWRPPSTARIRLQLDDTGEVRAVGSAASQDLGTGTWTIGTQITAELTGLPLERVRFEIGDSDLPRSGLSGGSSTAGALSHALVMASVELKGVLLEFAKDSPVAGLERSEVELKGGRLVSKADPSRAASLESLIARAGSGYVEGINDPQSDPVVPGGEDFASNKEQFAFHSFGAHFVEVAIDDPVPLVRVKRVVSVIDVGRILNWRTARSQVIGGVVMGIGMALTEETRFDSRTGRVVNDNFADYAIPVNADIHDIEVDFIDIPDTRFGALGSRGVGEIGITGVAAAIGNAVYHATGRRIRDLPITPDKLL